MNSATIDHLLRDLRWAITPLGLFVYFVARWWLRMRRRPPRKSLGEALISFQASIAGMAAIVAALMFSFSTPVLSTFGVPSTEADVTDPRRLLHLMQMYNRELVSASEGVQSLAVFGLIVLVAGGNLARAVVEVEGRRSGSQEGLAGQGSDAPSAGA